MMKNIHDKLTSRGVESLDDRELIALLIERNAEDADVEKLVDAIFAECGTLGGLRRVALSRLRMVGGMGIRRAEKIVAAMELGRRIALLDSTEMTTILNNDDVVSIMRPMLQGLTHEECWALYLTSTNKVVEQMRISQGGVQATVVDCRLIVKRALELLCAKIILIHNHPSGTPKPSQQDIQLTEKVRQAAGVFDIELLDHIIISSEGSYSFRATGVLK